MADKRYFMGNIDGFTFSRQYEVLDASCGDFKCIDDNGHERWIACSYFSGTKVTTGYIDGSEKTKTTGYPNRLKVKTPWWKIW